MSEKTIIFYSGKLWHSDKPFPVKPKTNASILEDKYLLEVRSWLSTAYEVVNPELITGGFHKSVDEWNRAFQDGDQITLPEGYGIKKHLQWHPVGCEGKWQNTNEYYFDTVQFPCGKRRAATITLPEKTENSADGHTDLINKFKGKVKDLIEIRRSEHDSNFNYSTATDQRVNDELEYRCRKLLNQIKS